MKIKDFCTFAPKSKIKAGQAIKDGQYMFFTSSKDENKRYIDYLYDGEGIIMGTGGNATLHYYKGKYAVSTDCIVLNPDERIRCKYLYYFFLANMAILEAGFKGAGLKHTNRKYIENIVVSKLPTFDEQDSVIKILDKISDIIRFRNLELKVFDNLIKARFVEMFGDPEFNEKHWRVMPLDKLCEVGSSKRIYQDEQSQSGVPFLRISDLVNKIDTGSSESELFIPEKKYDELKKEGLVPSKGDILLTARGTLGRCYIITEKDRFYFQDGMITWLSNFSKVVTSLYIFYLFTIPGFRKQIDALQSGSTVAYLSIAMTRNLNIMVPSLDLQNKFIDFVYQVNKSKVAIQKSLDETQLLFDSLMQKYFE